ARYDVLDGGAAVAVSVDPAWLAGLAADVFPVRLDPSVVLANDAFAFQNLSWADNGATFMGEGMYVGRLNGVNWRGQFHFNYEDVRDQYPQYVFYEAFVALDRDSRQTNV